MEKENTMRILAIGVGLLISIVVLWFGFRLIQSRFSHASTTITNADCVQNQDSPSTYTATFDLGEKSDTVDVAWGLDTNTLTSHADSNCTGTSCTANFDLVPADSVPSYIVLIGGVRVGKGATNGDSAKPFDCQPSKTNTAQTNPLPTSTASNSLPTQVPSPTSLPERCPTVRALSLSWNPSWNPSKCFAAGYNAQECGCMMKDKSSDGR